LNIWLLRVAEAVVAHTAVVVGPEDLELEPASVLLRELITQLPLGLEAQAVHHLIQLIQVVMVVHLL
jgi:hypothetical protein